MSSPVLFLAYKREAGVPIASEISEFSLARLAWLITASNASEAAMKRAFLARQQFITCNHW